MRKIALTIITIGLLIFLKSDSALAQSSCTNVPPTNTGKVTLSTTTTAGTYRIWSRMKAADSTNNSFYVQVDGTCPLLIGNSSNITTGWNWVDYQNNNSSQKADVTLTAGDHDIIIIGNEPGVGVDKLLLTKNLSCVPTGMSGDNCPAETLTPSPGADTTKPVISSVTATNITNTGATINWNLSEVATGQVDYGTTTSYGQQSTKETSFNWDHHAQALSNLTPGTTYHYRVTSADQAGNQAVSGDFTFTTLGGTSPSPIPNTPTKTPTPLPNTTVLRLQTLKLHGIGTGGDNTGENLPGTSSPKTTQRSVTIEILDGDNAVVATANGTVNYNASLGYYAGDITLPSNITSARYIIKVRTPRYLKKQLPGTTLITNGTVNSLPAVTLVAGDVNDNNSREIADYNIIADCYADLLPAKNCADSAKKTSADITDDGIVNHFDFDLYLRELSVVSGD